MSRSIETFTWSNSSLESLVKWLKLKEITNATVNLSITFVVKWELYSSVLYITRMWGFFQLSIEDSDWVFNGMSFKSKQNLYDILAEYLRKKEFKSKSDTVNSIVFWIEDTFYEPFTNFEENNENEEDKKYRVFSFRVWNGKVESSFNSYKKYNGAEGISTIREGIIWFPLSVLVNDEQMIVYAEKSKYSRYKTDTINANLYIWMHFSVLEKVLEGLI